MRSFNYWLTHLVLLDQNWKARVDITLQHAVSWWHQISRLKVCTVKHTVQRVWNLDYCSSQWRWMYVQEWGFMQVFRGQASKMQSSDLLLTYKATECVSGSCGCSIQDQHCKNWHQRKPSSNGTSLSDKEAAPGWHIWKHRVMHTDSNMTIIACLRSRLWVESWKMNLV